MARAIQGVHVSLWDEATKGEREMSQIVTISDALYARLEATAHLRGLASIEQLLEAWQARDDELVRRRDVVHRIDTLQERLFATDGELPDSVGFIREDRAR
jgi:hypothetical protein